MGKVNDFREFRDVGLNDLDEIESGGFGAITGDSNRVTITMTDAGILDFADDTLSGVTDTFDSLANTLEDISDNNYRSVDQLASTINDIHDDSIDSVEQITSAVNEVHADNLSLIRAGGAAILDFGSDLTDEAFDFADNALTVSSDVMSDSLDFSDHALATSIDFANDSMDESFNFADRALTLNRDAQENAYSFTGDVVDEFLTQNLHFFDEANERLDQMQQEVFSLNESTISSLTNSHQGSLAAVTELSETVSTGGQNKFVDAMKWIALAFIGASVVFGVSRFMVKK